MATTTSAMQLVGAAELHKLLAEYPANVTRLAARKGVREAAKRLNELFIAAAPKGPSGRLKKAIRQVRTRGPNRWTPRFKVGLGYIKGERSLRGYYKTLEMHTKRGEPLHPFFLNTWNAHGEAIAQMIVNETRKAVYSEAAKVHRKTLGLPKRRSR